MRFCFRWSHFHHLMEFVARPAELLAYCIESVARRVDMSTPFVAFVAEAMALHVDLMMAHTGLQVSGVDWAMFHMDSLLSLVDLGEFRVE